METPALFHSLPRLLGREQGWLKLYVYTVYAAQPQPAPRSIRMRYYPVPGVQRGSWKVERREVHAGEMFQVCAGPEGSTGNWGAVGPKGRHLVAVYRGRRCEGTCVDEVPVPGGVS